MNSIFDAIFESLFAIFLRSPRSSVRSCRPSSPDGFCESFTFINIQSRRRVAARIGTPFCLNCFRFAIPAEAVHRPEAYRQRTFRGHIPETFIESKISRRCMGSKNRSRMGLPEPHATQGSLSGGPGSLQNDLGAPKSAPREPQRRPKS